MNSIQKECMDWNS